jgi:hypothetical protein
MHDPNRGGRSFMTAQRNTKTGSSLQALMNHSRSSVARHIRACLRWVRSQRSQSLVEFSMVAPVFLVIIFAAIDISRLLYTYTAISSAARDGARTASLQSAIYSDCQIIAEVEVVGQGFPVQMDPKSLVGNSDPNNPSGPLQPTAPPPNVGYAYIWPAVATAYPADANCNSGSPRAISQTVRHVAVEVQYHFVALTPFIAQITPGFIVKTVSVVAVE